MSIKLPALFIHCAAALALGAPLDAAAEGRYAHCASCGVAALSLAGPALSVTGAAFLLASPGSLVVEAVETGAASTILVLKGASDAGKVSVNLSRDALGGVSLATGATIDVVASAAGSTLMLAGKALAFIPNEVGASMLHHRRVAERGAR